jgi:Mlc titration factor MtfA (ptsG expression regulator)
MLGRLWRGWQSARERSAVQRRAIPDDLWKRTLIRYPFLQRREPADAAELRRLTSLFLDRKEFDCTGGLKLTNALAVSIAAQAALPVLRLGLEHYDGFVGIVVHPEPVVARRSQADDDGVVHEYDEPLAGEAMEGGPMMLVWPDVRRAGQSAEQGYNVVIHEFAHVLDMADGLADGVPLLPPDIDHDAWCAVLDREYETFVARVEREEDTALDPYGASAVEEFFAVASESFFVDPLRLRAEHAALYEQFRNYYGQDPVSDLPAKVLARP